MFHTDLLTPGIVQPDDPPPLMSGMSRVTLDHQGRLTFFETIPPQRLDAPTHATAVDWTPLFALADLDRTRLVKAEPVWTWLATSDTRDAWTGTWPDSGRAFRVEAAALGGRPVGFLVVDPSVKPWRMSQSSQRGENIIVTILFALTVGIFVGAGVLARNNLRSGRGDRTGATRLAVFMSAVLLAVWVCQVHLVASLGLLAMFLIAVCTSVFYGVLLWTIYVALEPYVRKRWPQVLVSWTNVLTGHLRDPIVGRDVLLGVALGVTWVLILRGVDLWGGGKGFINFPGAIELLQGTRSTAGVVLQYVPYAIRNVLLYFCLLFTLRVLLRNQWAAAAAFAGFFVVLGVIGSDDKPWIDALSSLLYFGFGAVAVLRWGLLTYAVGVFVAQLLIGITATSDTSAWYFGNMLLLIGLAVALTVWGFYTCQPGRAVNRQTHDT
jgi:hypothetical protein